MIDTHCHLNPEDYVSYESVIERMGTNLMIVSGTHEKDNEWVLNLCDRYSNIYGVVGFHPEYACEWGEETKARLKQMLAHPKVVGIGEIGLDYHYDNLNKELQKKVFWEQLELAKQYCLPAVIHSRDAILDTYQLLRDIHMEELPSVMHCYSSSLEMAEQFLKLKMKLGIGGVVTFKNGTKLKEIVKKLPLTSFLLETDSPYLSPEPYRGKKNEPRNIELVAEEIARLKDCTKEEVVHQTTMNAGEIFPKLRGL